MSKTVYIVISQTGTALSRILKFITGAKYNHASISLEPDLSTMYSFGRTNPYNPFHGGFVTESPNYGTFKRFSGTKVEVLSIAVSEGQYINLGQMLEGMAKNKKRYHYNYLDSSLQARISITGRQIPIIAPNLSRKCSSETASAKPASLTTSSSRFSSSPSQTQITCIAAS